MMAASPREQIDWSALMPEVAPRLLGSPNDRLSSSKEMRFGSKGSMSVDVEAGTFYDHETGKGGGVLDLVKHKQGCDDRGAFEWLENEQLLDPKPDQPEVWQLGKPARPVFYDYRDEQGAILFRVERTPDRRFYQHSPDGRGGFARIKGGMADVRRVPYRLPELLAAAPNRVVFVVEGEKDADRLASMGLVATTSSEGAGKFRAELAPHFAGRKVAVIADNDEPGQKHAADVVAKLRDHAEVVTILNLPDLPPKGDVSDWLNVGGTKGRLQELTLEALENPVLAAIDTPASNPPNLLPVIDMTLWGYRDPPHREWALKDWIPAHQATFLTGPGSAGKSLLSQQLCTCIALGLPFLGVETKQSPAMYVTCEDDADELERRQKGICEALGVTADALAGKLFLVSLVGEIGNEMARFGSDGRMMPAETYERIRDTAVANQVGFVALDNVAHFFGGNENIRNEVAAFCGLQNQLAVAIDGSVLFIGHPNKAGDSYSGSTAWENQVRSRLYMETPKDGEGVVEDPDVRVLSRGKANYARNGEAVEFRWHNWAFVRMEDLSADYQKEVAANAAANADNEIFLECLRVRNKQRRPVSEVPCPNYAVTQFAEMAESKKIGKKRLSAAMDRLYRVGRIERALLWKDTRKGREVFGLAEVTPNATPIGFPNASPNPPRTPPEPEPRTTPNIYSIPKGNNGAAHGAAAPYPHNNPALVTRAGKYEPILVPGDEDDEPFSRKPLF